MKDAVQPWPTIPLGTLAAEMCLGKMLDKKKNRGTLQPYLRNVNVRWFLFDLSDLKEMRFESSDEGRYQLQPGDLVICEGGEPGRSAVWRGQAENAKIQKALHRVRFRPDEYEPSFAMYYLYFGTTTNRFARYYTGTTIKHLTGIALSQVHFPLPPLNEQRRIVETIEELFTDLDAGVAALERVLIALKRYRAAVLKAAVEGKLTAAWRAKHPATEPASKLLQRILDDRRRKWEQEQRAKYAKADKEPPKGWQHKYREPAAPDTTGLPELPHGWRWARLDTIADVVGGVTKDQKRAKEEGIREVPYLRVANVQRGFLDLSEMKTILASEAEVTELQLQKGDILFTEGGDRDKLGRGWVWNEELPECIHQNHIFRARLLVPEIQARFVSHHGNSFGQQWFTKAGKQTTNLASINLGILRQFPVPIPPPDEQAQIVAELDKRLSLIDATEAQIEHGLIRAARLRQSILKRAFEGRLVPQDPSDEPADKLLGRIRQQRQGPPGNREPRRKRRSLSKRRGR